MPEGLTIGHFPKSHHKKPLELFMYGINPIANQFSTYTIRKLGRFHQIDSELLPGIL